MPTHKMCNVPCPASRQGKYSLLPSQHLTSTKQLSPQSTLFAHSQKIYVDTLHILQTKLTSTHNLPSMQMNKIIQPPRADLSCPPPINRPSVAVWVSAVFC